VRIRPGRPSFKVPWLPFYPFGETVPVVAGGGSDVVVAAGASGVGLVVDWPEAGAGAGAGCEVAGAATESGLASSGISSGGAISGGVASAGAAASTGFGSAAACRLFEAAAFGRFPEAAASGEFPCGCVSCAAGSALVLSCSGETGGAMACVGAITSGGGTGADTSEVAEVAPCEDDPDRENARAMSPAKTTRTARKIVVRLFDGLSSSTSENITG
jgi:hypothetical protein